MSKFDAGILKTDKDDLNEPPEMVSGVSPENYQKMMTECKRKGHTFTISKFGKKRLVKLFDEEMYEVVNGEKDRRIMELTNDHMKQSEMLSGFGKGLQELMKSGMSQDEAFCFLTSMMEEEEEEEDKNDDKK